jgi:hypothetical protein
MNEVRRLLEASDAHPFLFIGSGFTHRYLQTDDWKTLIARFASQARPDVEFAYELYRNALPDPHLLLDELLPQITQFVEKDYTDRFLTDPAYAGLRDKYRAAIAAGVSALKIGVADHFFSLEDRFASPQKPSEIEALKRCRKNVAGIITTNFDRFLEAMFPDLQVYIGQDELLFNQSFAIGEIYKIHGCASKPESLILTQSDYERFKKRYAYLSAKLLTIFLEHPIVFFGYSLNDPNIRRIIADIVECLNDEQLAKLSNRIFFVQRKKADRSEGLSTILDSFSGRTIEFKQIATDDFSLVYDAISELRTAYSPQILRKLKQDVYELVVSTTPKERIKVVDIDDATTLDEVEIVIGVGVANKLSGLGYERLEFGHLCEDLLNDGSGYDATQIVEKTLPKLGKSISFNIPVFKYISTYKGSSLDPSLKAYIDNVNHDGLDFFRSKSIRKRLDLGFKSVKNIQTAFNLSDATEASKALVEVVRLPPESIDLDDLLALLRDVTGIFNFVLKAKAPLPSDYRRAVRVYDWLKYGRKKTPDVPSNTEAN